MAGALFPKPFRSYLLWHNDPGFDIHKLGSWALVGMNLTFLRGFFGDFLFTGVTQGWTLTVEETFYFLAPLLLLALTKSKNKYVVLSLFALGCLAFGVLLVEQPLHPYKFFVQYDLMLYRTFFGRVIEFMLGAGLAVFIRQHDGFPSKGWATLVGVVWILSSVVVMSAITTKDLDSWNNLGGIAFNNLWLPLGVVLLFYGLITERTWLRRVLETPLAQTLGKSSYAFYLLHVGVLSMFIEHYLSSNPLVLFAVSLVLAWVVWKWVEEPANHWLRGKVAQRPAPELVDKASKASTLTT
jgi:peptidoglycan/LPS O-acetylase OafA/YrhL